MRITSKEYSESLARFKIEDLPPIRNEIRKNVDSDGFFQNHSENSKGKLIKCRSDNDILDLVLSLPGDE